ncbi:MAG TPA: pyrimidine dimer DNA glycosylase/endonuclease V [Thermoanaerobaculia bacterium]|jgi:hypothetical protein|nr:pyrimidine dimer DNA glycosylase/endonuclease V [Thermoanaerobaculia bacterium]
MRLWSLHPQYLDAKGLVALWREGLLAQAVLAGRTRGYRAHPQLERFRADSSAIGIYLHYVADEAESRGYNFDRSKLPRRRKSAALIEVSIGQLRFEWQHLRAKLRDRDPVQLRRFAQRTDPLPHPFFVVVPGSVAAWEKVHR